MSSAPSKVSPADAHARLNRPVRSADFQGMTAGERNFPVEQDATFRRRITWGGRLAADATPQAGDITTTLDDGTVIQVRPYDLTGCTARMQIRRSFDSEPAFVTLTTDVNGGLSLGGTTGTIDILMTPAQTNSLTVTKPRYDLIVTFPGGDVKRALQGRLLVSKNITELA